LQSPADGTLTISNSGQSNYFYLSTPGAATLHLGQADAAAPAAQTFGVQNVVAGTSNTAGANFTINGSQGTGTGAGGNIIFQTAPVGTSGTAQNALSQAMTITGAGNVGIGTAAPQSALQINGGEVQVGSSGASCTSNKAGAVRYASGLMYYCTGSAWNPFSSSCFGSSSGGTDTSLASGLVAYWNFNENSGTAVYDDTGNGNNGAFAGSTGSQWVTGIIGSGLSFNGTNNFINVPQINVFPSGTFTYSAWIYISGSSGVRTIIGGGSNFPQLRVDATTNILDLLKEDTVSVGTSTAAVPTGAWTHVVLTYASGGNYTFYINGVSSGSGTYGGSFTNTGIDIGANGTNTTEYFSGDMDEVGVWNVALTSTQVTALYNSGAGNSYGAFVCPALVNSNGGFAN
jgi:Concanavalin A-like lectin/glucanases superfamily